MATLDKIKNIIEQISNKQSLSVMYADAISSITESTNPDGDVELVISRTNKKFILPANGLVNTLTNKKDNVDQQINNLLDKITIA